MHSCVGNISYSDVQFTSLPNNAWGQKVALSLDEQNLDDLRSICIVVIVECAITVKKLHKVT